MERNDDSELPARRPSGPPAEAQRFTTPELEAVIRRAVELQQTGGRAAPEEGLGAAEVVRIGQELGLDPAAVRRAMAEVRTRVPEEHGVLTGLVGPGSVRASRVIERPAAELTAQLDRYLRELELMVPQRRFIERTRYVRDSSIAAGLTRLARGFSRSQQPLGFQQLDVAVSAIDSASSLVEVGVDMSGPRAGLAGGMLGGSGGLAAAWAAVVWATPIADPLMLVGVPAVGGAWYGMRAIYRTMSRSMEEKLETLLDRAEHDFG